MIQEVHMFYVIAVAVSAFFSIAINLASTERFVDNLKRSRILIPVLCIDILFIVPNLILRAMSLQLMPNILHIASVILVIVTVFAGLFGITRQVGIYLTAGVLALFVLFVSIMVIPVDHGIKEFDGEEYVGITSSIDSINDYKFIYYYKNESSFIISSEYDYSEYYGMHVGSDWGEITKDGPHDINYYEDGRLVRTQPIYDWIK